MWHLMVDEDACKGGCHLNFGCAGLDTSQIWTVPPASLKWAYIKKKTIYNKQVRLSKKDCTCDPSAHLSILSQIVNIPLILFKKIALMKKL